MKRGFLAAVKAKRHTNHQVLQVPGVSTQPVIKKLPVRRVDAGAPQEGDDHSATQTLQTQYSDDRSYMYATVLHSGDDTLGENRDGQTECLFFGGQPNHPLLAAPGFPSTLSQPSVVRQRIGQSTYGLGMFAITDLQTSDLIMSERPLLLAPGAPCVPLPDLPYGSGEILQQIIKTRVMELEKLLETSIGRMGSQTRADYMALQNCHTEEAGPIFGRVRTNGLSMKFKDGESTDEDDQFDSYMAVFKTLSRVNHSCTPNTICKQDIATFSYQLRAIRPIKVGEEITINYCDIRFTDERQAELHFCGFQCSCVMCSNPSKADELLARIHANAPHDPTAITTLDPETLQNQLNKHVEWIALIEATGWQILREYLAHLVAAFDTAHVLGKHEDEAKYEALTLAWYVAHYGEVPPQVDNREDA